MCLSFTAGRLAPVALRRFLIGCLLRLVPRQRVAKFFPPASSYTGNTAHVVLPTPPADTAEIIRKTSETGFGLRIALVPQALQYRETPQQIAAKQLDLDYAAARDRWEARLDPIVYVELRSAVAVVAQFGDFPIEKAVVERVAASEHLL